MIFLKQELTKDLFFQANFVLEINKTFLHVSTAAPIFELITNLTIDSVENQTILRSSGCLNNITDIFLSFDFEVCT